MEVFVLLYKSGDITEVMDVYDSEASLLQGIQDEIAGGRLQKSKRYDEMMSYFAETHKVCALTEALKDGRVSRRSLKGFRKEAVA